MHPFPNGLVERESEGGWGGMFDDRKYSPTLLEFAGHSYRNRSPTQRGAFLWQPARQAGPPWAGVVFPIFALLVARGPWLGPSHPIYAPVGRQSCALPTSVPWVVRGLRRGVVEEAWNGVRGWVQQGSTRFNMVPSVATVVPVVQQEYKQ